MAFVIVVGGGYGLWTAVGDGGFAGGGPYQRKWSRQTAAVAVAAVNVENPAAGRIGPILQ